jgi:hypothetical protein
VEILRAFAYFNTMTKRKIRADSGWEALATSFRYPGEQRRAIRKQVASAANTRVSFKRARVEQQTERRIRKPHCDSLPTGRIRNKLLPLVFASARYFVSVWLAA